MEGIDQNSRDRQDGAVNQHPDPDVAVVTDDGDAQSCNIYQRTPYNSSKDRHKQHGDGSCTCNGSKPYSTRSYKSGDGVVGVTQTTAATKTHNGSTITM